MPKEEMVRRILENVVFDDPGSLMVDQGGASFSIAKSYAHSACTEQMVAPESPVIVTYYCCSHQVASTKQRLVSLGHLWKRSSLVSFAKDLFETKQPKHHSRRMRDAWILGRFQVSRPVDLLLLFGMPEDEVDDLEDSL